MIDLKYSLVIEATEDPSFFGFYSPDLEGFTGVGHSVEDCLYKAKWGMEEYLTLMEEQGLSIPSSNPDPEILVVNERRDKTPEALDDKTPEALRRPKPWIRYRRVKGCC